MRRRRWNRPAAPAAWCCLAALAAAMPMAPAPLRAGGAPATILVRAKRVLPVAADAIENGAVLVRDGRIAAVGTGLDAPAGAAVVDYDGTLIPGLIDAGTTLGLGGPTVEEADELSPEMRIADGLDFDDQRLRRALAAGVTAAAVVPEDRDVIGGLGAVIRTSPARRREAILREEAFLAAALTLETASGNYNMRGSPPYSLFHRLPTTRMGTVFLLRRAFAEASGLEETADPLLAGAEWRMTPLLSAAGRALLRDAAAGRRPLRLRAVERQEIEAALRIADEHSLPLVLEGALGAGGLIEELARRRLSVVLSAGAHLRLAAGEEAAPGTALDLPRRLSAAGVRFAYASESGARSPELRRLAALDLRLGLAEGAALRALTLDAAAILGLEAEIGAIAPGRRADLVAIEGVDPLSPLARVAWVMADGVIHRDPHAETATPSSGNAAR